MKPLLVMLASFTSGSALAHEGHGNTPIHALAHFLESNGFALWLVLIAAIAFGLLRATSAKDRQK